MVINCLIGKDYYRVRIGISHPGDKDRVTNHVLGDLSKEDSENLEKILSSIAKNITILIEYRVTCGIRCHRRKYVCGFFEIWC